MTPGDDLPVAEDNIFTTVLIVIGLLCTVAMAIVLGLSDGEQILPAPAMAATPADQVALVPLMLPTSPLPTTAPTATPTDTPEPTQETRISPTLTPTPTPIAVLAEAICGNVPDGWRPYTVQQGDHLAGLSASSGATTNEIMQANCLERGVLLVGRQIYLPSAPPERPLCGPPRWWAYYLVSRGDTLFSLAWRHGTTVFAIMQANCLVSTRIYAGQYLYLPPVSAFPYPPATPTNSPTPSPSPTVTRLPSATPLPTATQTPVSTPTATSTATSTATATPPTTQTPSPTPSPSTTPALTPATTTPTTTPIGAPTGTPTPTSTTQPTATATPLPSSTPSATATQPPTSTATLAPTATETPISDP